MEVPGARASPLAEGESLMAVGRAKCRGCVHVPSMRRHGSQAKACMIRHPMPMAPPAVVDLSIDVDEDAGSCH